MDENKLKACIKPNTPKTMVNLILFNNSHHYNNLLEKNFICKFKNSELSEYIDFEKLENYDNVKPVHKTVKEIEEESKVTITFNHKQISELFNLLTQNQKDHPELHELVYQSMMGNLFNRINNKET